MSKTEQPASHRYPRRFTGDNMTNGRRYVECSHRRGLLTDVFGNNTDPEFDEQFAELQVARGDWRELTDHLPTPATAEPTEGMKAAARYLFGDCDFEISAEDVQLIASIIAVHVGPEITDAVAESERRGKEIAVPVKNCADYHEKIEALRRERDDFNRLYRNAIEQSAKSHIEVTRDNNELRRERDELRTRLTEYEAVLKSRQILADEIDLPDGWKEACRKLRSERDALVQEKHEMRVQRDDFERDASEAERRLADKAAECERLMEGHRYLANRLDGIARLAAWKLSNPVVHGSTAAPKGE